MGFLEYFNKWVIVAIVFICLFGWITTTQEDNNVSEKIINEKLINSTFGKVKADVITYESQAQTQKGSFESETPSAGYGSLLIFSIVSSGKVFNGMTIGLYNSLIKLGVVYLGISPEVIGALSLIMIVTIIILLWILYKLG